MTTVRFFIASAVLMFVLPLQAERRTYVTDKPIGQMVPDLISGLGKYGFKFQVRQVYNEQRDGRQGFVFWLFPGKNHCEITFYERKKPKGSLVRILTQNAYDAGRFHHFFLNYMKMKELEATDTRIIEEKGGSGWPMPR